MKYYEILPLVDVNVGGNYDGSAPVFVTANNFVSTEVFDTYKKNYLSNDPKIYWDSIFKLPSLDLSLRNLSLVKGAKFMDILEFRPSRTSPGGLLFNDKAKQVFERYQLGEHKWHLASFANTNSQYNFFAIQCLGFDSVVFEKSTFYKSNRQQRLYVDIKTKEDFIATKLDEILDTDKIMLSDEFDTSLDLFIIPISIPRIFISNRLADDILAHRLVGLEIRSQDDLIHHGGIRI